MKYYYQNDLLHRNDDLPAIEYPDGSKFYYSHGILHRVGGPAIIKADGSKSYYLKGIWYSKKEYCNKLKEKPIRKEKPNEEPRKSRYIKGQFISDEFNIRLNYDYNTIKSLSNISIPIIEKDYFEYNNDNEEYNKVFKIMLYKHKLKI